MSVVEHLEKSGCPLQKNPEKQMNVPESPGENRVSVRNKKADTVFSALFRRISRFSYCFFGTDVLYCPYQRTVPPLQCGVSTVFFPEPMNQRNSRTDESAQFQTGKAHMPEPMDQRNSRADESVCS